MNTRTNLSVAALLCAWWQAAANIICAVAVLTIVAIGLGYAGCRAAKAMKRLDGIQDKRFSDHNETNLSFYLPEGVALDSLLVTVERVYFTNLPWDYYPPAFDVKSTTLPDVPKPRLLYCLREDGLPTLWLGSASTRWERGLVKDYIPVDEVNYPYAFPAYYGPLPVPARMGTLLSSVDLIEWTTVMQVFLYTNNADSYPLDMEGPHKFYRITIP